MRVVDVGMSLLFVDDEERVAMPCRWEGVGVGSDGGGGEGGDGGGGEGGAVWL